MFSRMTRGLCAVAVASVLFGVCVPVVAQAQPVITSTGAQHAVVDSGGTAQITQSVAATPAPTLQWFVSDDIGTTWTTVTDGGVYSGTTTNTLTISGATTSMSGAWYRLMATNDGGTATGQPVALVVTEPFSFITISGDRGTAGATDGPSIGARFNRPTGLAVDGAGNIYIADMDNHVIRRIAASDGAVTTLAGTAGVPGSADGVGAAAGFRFPEFIAVTSDGVAFVSDRDNHTIRRIAPDGTVTTLAGLAGAAGGADGIGSAARFSQPNGLAVAADGSVYVADGPHTIRRVTQAGEVTTVAGLFNTNGNADGTGSAARFADLRDIDFDASGRLYIADGRAIRRMSTDFVVTTLVPGRSIRSTDGPVTRAGIDPQGLVVLADGDVLFTDADRTVRRLSAAGVVTTLAGLTLGAGSADGTGSLVRFADPWGIAVRTNGAVLVADGSESFIPLAAEGHIIRSGTAGVLAVPPACSYSVTPIEQSVQSIGTIPGGGPNNTRSVTVTTEPGCPWTASSSTGNMSLSPTAGNGSAIVSVHVGPNQGPPRVLTGTVAGVQITINQAGNCGVTITGTTSFTWQGGNGTATGSLSAGCASDFWSASTLASWITITGATSGNGAINLSYTLAPYSGTESRQGSITVVSSTGESSSLIISQSAPSLLLSTNTLVFGVNRASAGAPITHVSPAQPITLTWEGPAAPVWSAAIVQGSSSVTPSWLHVTPTSGTGTTTISVEVRDDGGVLPGALFTSGNESVIVRFTSPGFTGVDLIVSLRLLRSTDQIAGYMDTPSTSGPFSGSLAVTGWALDLLGVDRVEVWRDCIETIDRPAGACGSAIPGGPDTFVFVGYANFVRGARPDVEVFSIGYPNKDRAGWGLMVLTNEMPHIPTGRPKGGQGAFNISAFAVTMDGRYRRLSPGARAITLDNDNATAPFGTIDTPTQGGTVSGVLNNFGWTLTPDPGTGVLVPTDGSTIRVFVDGIAVGTATYNLCRGSVGANPPPGVLCDDDVSTTFRGDGTRYRNLDAGRGAIGLRSIDTTTLSNGLHTLSWGVVDSASRGAGIGSRYFNVQNPVADACGAECGVRSAKEVGRPEREGRQTRSSVIYARTGFDLQSAYTPLATNADSVAQVRIPELGRVELQIPGVESGVLLVNGEPRALPIGVGIDRERGVVTWVAGPAYLGTYRLSFVVQGPTGSRVQGPVIDVTVAPASGVGELVRMHVDRIDQRAGAVTVHGWAFDPQAATGAGVGAVHIWGKLVGPGVQGSKGPEVVGAAAPIFFGVANLGVSRPDVAAAHGAAFQHAGFRFDGTLPEGTWEITAYVWVSRTGRFEDARSVAVVVK